MSKLLIEDIDDRQPLTKNAVRFQVISDWLLEAKVAYLTGNDKLTFSLIDSSIKALVQMKKDIEQKKEAGE